MIRKARMEECAALYDLLYEIFLDMELPVLELLDPKVMKEAIVCAMQQDYYRFSYRNGLVFERDNEILGCCFGYKGVLEKTIDEALHVILNERGMPSTLSLFPDPETFAGEWYLDCIVTKKTARGKGIAAQLLQALPAVANAAGESIIGLNCEKDNVKAQQLYEKIGFITTSERTLSHHPYDHMQWFFEGATGK